MQIRDLSLFVRVVAAGSLSQAGRDLGLSAAVASKRLAALETDLGVRLLHRSTRQLTLTPEGETFLAHADRMVREAEAGRDAVGQGVGRPRGLLRATVPASFGRLHVSPAIPDFMTRYPDIVLDLRLSDSMIDLVGDGLDVALRIGALPDSSLIARRLAPNRRFLCATPDYLARHGIPRSVDDLLNHNCLKLSDHPGWMIAPPGQPTRLVRVTGSLATNNGEVLRDAVLGGLGIAMKSNWDVGPYMRQGRLAVVLPDCRVDTDAALWAVYPSARYLAPKVRAFVDFFADRFGPCPYWDAGLPAGAAQPGAADGQGAGIRSG